jgi:hypothetical protein
MNQRSPPRPFSPYPAPCAAADRAPRRCSRRDPRPCLAALPRPPQALKVGENLKDSAEFYRVLKASDGSVVSLASFVNERKQPLVRGRGGDGAVLRGRRGAGLDLHPPRARAHGCREGGDPACLWQGRCPCGDFISYFPPWCGSDWSDQADARNARDSRVTSLHQVCFRPSFYPPKTGAVLLPQGRHPRLHQAGARIPSHSAGGCRPMCGRSRASSTGHQGRQRTGTAW